MKIEKIKQAANEIFDADCMEKSQVVKHVLCRMAAANFIKRNCKFMTFEELGRIFKKNHGTIIHYFKNHNSEYQHNKDYRANYDRLCEMILTFQDAKNENILIENNLVLRFSKGKKCFTTTDNAKRRVFATTFSPEQLRAIAYYLENFEN